MATMGIKELQLRLMAAGFDVGPDGADGKVGRNTTNAVARFQKSQGLQVKWPGTIGPMTIAALNTIELAHALDDVAVIPEHTAFAPVWLTQAKKWIGQTEIPGAKSNPQILAWGKAAEDWYMNDDTPWCGAFVHGTLAASLPSEPLPADPLYALNWRTWGRGLDKPAFGCIAVFSRTGGGHVGYYVGETDDAWAILGGNQSNQVRISLIKKKSDLKLAALRWPQSANVPCELGPVAYKGDAAFAASVV